ncbi:MAG: DoxX family protein [Chloroflexota bacterium]
MNILIVVTSIFIFVVGIAKLWGAKPLADQFEEFGLPKIAMYGVGALEVAAAITLNFDLLTFYAACGLILLMIGAIYNHLQVNHSLSSSVPAILVLILSAVIAITSLGTAGEIFSALGLT